MRSFWINQVGPKSNDKCPPMRQKRKGHREKKGRPCEGESEVGEILPQAKECLEPLGAGRGKGTDSFLELPEGMQPC